MTAIPAEKALSNPTQGRQRSDARMPTLREVQDAFQRAVIDGDDAILSLIPDNSRTGRDVLLGVYRHAYTGRLADIVASDYEALSAFMGEEPFRDMALDYVKACPSHSPNARWFSHRLPEFLSSDERFRSYPVLSELAAIERALSDAFDAADVTVADLETVKGIAPELWGEIRFSAHISLRRLDNTSNALAIWSAVKDGVPPPAAVELADIERILVWRQDTTSKIRALSPEEAMLWDEAAKGASFGALCELASVFDDPDHAALRAAQYLQTWLTTGVLADAAL